MVSSSFIDNKYTKWYNNIISNAKPRENIGYTEKHHILPKGLGGSNEKENLVRLTAREHFICHLLLTKMTIGKEYQKMSYALWRICNSGNIVLNSHMYKIIRENHSKMLSITKIGVKRKKFSDKARKNMSDAKIGKPGNKHTLDTKNKISTNRCGKCLGKNNASYNSQIYTFIHKIHGKFIGTKYDLYTKYDLCLSNLNKIISTPGRICKGWKLVLE